MGFLDKLLGRGKKAAGDLTGDSSMRSDGMHQEQEGMASDRAESAEQMAQEERERPRSTARNAPTRRRGANTRALGGRREPPSFVPSDGPSRVRRLMTLLATILVLLVGGGALAYWLSRRLAEHAVQSAQVVDQLLTARNTDVDGRLQALTATMERRLGELDTKVDRQLEHASKQTNAIHKQLGEVGQATLQMAEQAKELS